MTTYLISVFPGLASLAEAELRELTGAKALPAGRNRTAELLELRTNNLTVTRVRVAEDVFLELGRIPLTGTSADLKTLAGAAAWGGGLASALTQLMTIRPGIAPSRLRFRVVAQADDVRWRLYRRVDLQTAVEAAILKHHPKWRLERDEAPVEIWLHQLGRELRLSLRMTAPHQRSRGGRSVEREAALRPTIAAAMVRLSDPRPSDVVLDPMCGTGTLLLERAEAGRYRQLLGGDIDPGAVKAALANFGLRHQPREFSQWDARALPLDPASVTVVLCNLPWGRQIGNPRQLPELYAKVLAEAVRVLVPGGRMVLITSEWRELKAAVASLPRLRVQQTVPNVEVLGRRADIFVLQCT